MEIELQTRTLPNPVNQDDNVETSIRHKIMKKFYSNPKFSWPPTLDVTKYKSFFNHKTWWHDRMRFVPTASIPAGLLLFIIIGTTAYDENQPAISWTVGTTALMALWWVTEAVPLPITALLPLVLFPMTGVMDGEEVSAYYMNSTQFLMIGGFLLALAMEKWDLHKRISLKVICLVGLRPPLLLAGMMATTFISSMFVSNTAAVMMNIPNALALFVKLEQLMKPDEFKSFSKAVCLGIAYSAAFGGTASLVSTPPNLILVKIYSIAFPEGPEITYSKWLFVCGPISVLLAAMTFGLLYFKYCPKKSTVDSDISSFKKQYDSLGPLQFEQWVVVVAILLTVILWLFRVDIDFGGGNVVYGWSRIFPDPSFINDGTVAMFVSILLFIIPARDMEVEKTKNTEKEKEKTTTEEKTNEPNVHGHVPSPHVHPHMHTWMSRILGWKHASQLPWDVVLLLGGGFALSAAFKSSGLAKSLGDGLSGLQGASPFTLALLISVIVHILTEFTSNTATTQMTLPIVAYMAVSVKINPLLLMLPACLSSSYSFMMPIATPPNLLVFSLKKLTVRDMIVNGFLLDVVSIFVVLGGIFALAPPVFGFEINRFPEWGNAV